MTAVNTEITNMQSQTAYAQATAQKQALANGTSSASSTNDSNMFLKLMLQQLQNQDPTQPTDNTEWLAQLAQYSSLEQMTQMNEGLANCMNYMQALYSDNATNAEITQTLALIGKEVTVKDPKDETGKTMITGKVSEASFEDGTGKVKIDGEYYSIVNIVSVRDEK